MAGLIVLLVIAFVVLLVLARTVRIVPQARAGVVERLGRIDARRSEEHHTVVENYGLSTRLPAGSERARLLALMARDKKAHAGLSFVLDGPAGPELVHGVPPDDVDAILAEMSA